MKKLLRMGLWSLPVTTCCALAAASTDWRTATILDSAFIGLNVLGYIEGMLSRDRQDLSAACPASKIEP